MAKSVKNNLFGCSETVNSSINDFLLINHNTLLGVKLII